MASTRKPILEFHGNGGVVQLEGLKQQARGACDKLSQRQFDLLTKAPSSKHQASSHKLQATSFKPQAPSFKQPD